MRVNNKKYLLIILSVGVILTGVIVLRPKEEVKLDNVILKQEVNNKTFAMYKETGENNYVKVEDNKFPDMYVLNIEKSKCIDNNGNELDGVLGYENDKVTITSGNTTYCYLYFDKSLGEEIKETNPNKLSTAIKGAMYRFQGQQSDGVNNYICFGTSDKEKCTSAPDKYMYRIIGIEAETGRVKVIKKEALNETVQWWDNYDEDKTFPESRIYEALTKFLNNKDYVPEGWEEKISNNTWIYGDMWNNDTLGAKQTGAGLYQTETGQKVTQWYNHATKDTPGAIATTVGYEYSPYKDTIVYYTKGNGNWTEKFEGKVSLMYLHDYHYSVSDDANCQYDQNNYDVCRTGWMHLSQNDSDAKSPHEWTLSRYGWNPWNGWFNGRRVHCAGYTGHPCLVDSYSVRPVFYLASVNQLLGGSGTSEDPFILN